MMQRCLRGQLNKEIIKPTLPDVDEIKSLAGTKWKLNDTVDLSNNAKYHIAFTVKMMSGQCAFSGLKIFDSSLYATQAHFINNTDTSVSTAVTVLESTTRWITDNIIFFAGGEDESNSGLINWMKANATLIGAVTE